MLLRIGRDRPNTEADHRDFQGARGGRSGRRSVLATQHLRWKAKFGGMEVSKAKRLKTLEDEKTRLKRLLADATWTTRR